MKALSHSELDCISFHLGFGVVAAIALALPEPALGMRILGLALAYNLMLPAFAQWRGHADWLRLWLFLLPLSFLQVLPDNFLAGVLGVLVFADTGSPSIGYVPVFMAGMWVIPLFLLLMLGHGVEERWGRMASCVAVAFGSLLFFGGTEVLAARIPIWQAQAVHLCFGAAVYVLVPEMLLGVATLIAYEAGLQRGAVYHLTAAAAVMLFYLGALVLSCQLTERVLLG
jgi:hypothetical protein